MLKALIYPSVGGHPDVSLTLGLPLPLPPSRLPAGLLADRRLLQEPLPGGAAAAGGERSHAGVQGDPSDCHPRAEEPDDEAHLRRPLRLQSRPLFSFCLRRHVLRDSADGTTCLSEPAGPASHAVPAPVWPPSRARQQAQREGSVALHREPLQPCKGAT